MNFNFQVLIDIYPSSSDSFKRPPNFYEAARLAWLEILKGFEGKKVLLPSYIGFSEKEGSGIYDPIEELKVDHSFYLLDKDLNLDLDVLNDAMDSGAFHAILVVHYFGFVDPKYKELAGLCKKRGVALIEDCAHYFDFNGPRMESDIRGECAFYSLHKSLPVADGGVLVDFRSDSELPGTIENQDLKSNFNSSMIIDRRRSNFKFLYDQFEQHDNLVSFRRLNHYDIPNTFPILVEADDREQLYFHLIDHGFRVAALYYKLIQPLYADRFSSMADVSSRILNLPVHQGIEQNELYSMVSCINNFYESR